MPVIMSGLFVNLDVLEIRMFQTAEGPFKLDFLSYLPFNCPQISVRPCRPPRLQLPECLWTHQHGRLTLITTSKNQESDLGYIMSQGDETH